MPIPERIIGLDPGLGTTGWGLIETDGHRLRYLDAGYIAPPKTLGLPERLAFLHNALCHLLETHRPHRGNGIYQRQRQKQFDAVPCAGRGADDTGSLWYPCFGISRQHY